MNFGECASYMLKGFSNLPLVFNGFKCYTQNFIGNIINLITSKFSHRDITSVKDNIFMSWALQFSGIFIFSILSIILTSISAGFWGIFIGLFGGVFSIIGCIGYFVVFTICMYFGSKYQTHWNNVLIKVITVFYLIAILLAIKSILLGVLDFLDFYGIFSILLSIVMIVENLWTIGVIGLFFNGLFRSLEVNSNNGYTNSFNPQNTFNSQNNFGQQNDFSQQNGFNQQNNFNQQNGFGHQNNLGHQNNVNQKMLYECPYCHGAVEYGVNPCPHCNNMLNWG